MDLFGEPTPPEKEEPPAPEEAASEQDTPPPPAEESEHPRHAPFCLGHEKNEQALLEMYAQGRMPHGLIFSGPKGIGKATFAFRLAKFLFHQGKKETTGALPPNMDVPPEARASRLLFSGAHPDLLCVERRYDEQKGKIPENLLVDEVRKVAPFLRKTASQDGWRVVIIDDADTMNRNAQNALLKILEEPPPDTVLILVAHRIGAFLPTIRSRCRVMPFDVPPSEVFQTLLKHKGHMLDASEIQTLARISEGSIGRALEFIAKDSTDILTDILDVLDTYPRWQWTKIHTLSDKLSKQGRDETYQTFTTLLPWVFREIVHTKARQGALNGLFTGRSGVFALYDTSSLEQLVKICDTLHSHFDTVERANLDKRQAVLSAFSLIAP